jgi:bacillolysin
MKLLCLTTLALCGSLSVFAGNENDYRKLKENSQKLELRNNLGTPGAVQFSQNNKLAAADFFQTYINPNLADGSEIKELRKETDELGYTHHLFQQYFNNYVIEGAEYRITDNLQGINFASGYIYPITEMRIPVLSGQQALLKATGFIGATTYKWQLPEEEALLKVLESDASATYLPQGEQIILPMEDVQGNITYKTVFKFDVYAHQPMGRYFVYVDAVSGEVLKSLSRIHHNNEDGSGITLYNGNQSFKTDSYNGSYRLQEATSVGNATRSIKTFDMNNGTNYGSAVDFTDADNYWTDNTNKDRAGWSAHWGAEATWDYFYTVHSRNSYDGNGATINSYVHYDNNYSNAYWDGSKMTYGDGDGTNYDPLVGLDVVGHEITHAVTERSSNLAYQNESGALNESFSDIFGTSIEFYKEGSSGDYLIGEDFDIKNHQGFRSMSNPKAHGDPDTYKGTNWKSTSIFPNLADDYGGVHSNSGVQNHWFYILSAGKSGTNDKGSSYNVSAIGVVNAAKIAHRNNTTKLTSSSTYADARTGAIASATELFGAGSPEVIATTNAWYAVGVGSAYVGGPATCNTPLGLSASSITQTSVTLSWSAASGATAYNMKYKAQSASTWTTTTSASTSKAISGLTAGTAYEFQVQSDCGSANTSAFSSSYNFSTTSAGGGVTSYCASSGTDASSEWIQRVTLSNVDNNSGTNNGYGNYVSTVIQLTAGNVHRFTLTPGFKSGGLLGANSYPEYWRIWIDYNQDGDFTDSGEMAFDAGATSTTTVNGSITVPANALMGATRLRIQMKYNAAPTSCESFSYGEVEDYTVHITGSSTFATQTTNTEQREMNQLKMDVYPNPASNEVHVNWTEGNANYRLITLTGQVVKTGSFENNSVIQVSEFTNGLYILEVSSSLNTLRQQIVVRH